MKVTRYILYYRLAHVAVLEQTLFGHISLFQINTELQVFNHDWFQDFFRVGGGSVLFTLDDLSQGIQGPGGFPHFNELCKLNEISF